MASIAGLSNATGFSRDAISKRKTLFELDDDFDPRDVLSLKPLDSHNANRVSLEEARTRESIAKAEKVEIEVQTLRKERVPVDVVTENLSDLLETIKATIQASELSDKDKDDLFEDLATCPAKLKW